MKYSLFAFQRGGMLGFMRNRRGGAAGSEGGRRPLDRGRPGRGVGDSCGKCAGGLLDAGKM